MITLSKGPIDLIAMEEESKYGGDLVDNIDPGGDLDEDLDENLYLDSDEDLEVGNLKDEVNYSNYDPEEDYPDFIASSAADSEFINLVRDLITDVTQQKQLDFYLKKNPLTHKAKYKLKMYYRAVMNPALVVSNYKNEKQAERLHARYKIIKSQLTLGLTRYDINDSFMHVISIIDHAYMNQQYRAYGGFTMKRISTTTTENVNRDIGQPNDGEVEDRSIFRKLGFSRR